jgi:hypothetical protein
MPIGTGRRSDAPRTGWIFACPSPLNGGGARSVGDWVRDGRWNRALKPQVAGAVTWPDAAILVTRQEDRRLISANNLPTHPTGIYPVEPGDPAHVFDPNPNRIRPRPVAWTLPADPERAAAPSCLPMGPIGFAVTGAAIYHALDALGRDAPAYELLDRCNGHPQPQGQYHYHDWSDCLPDPAGRTGRHSDLVGYALDGFGIYGPIGDDGVPLATADLDACHGHEHELVWDGVTKRLYHYHFTADYPYSLGCFTGTPQRLHGRP